MKEKRKISVSIDDKGKVTWGKSERPAGLSVKNFVEEHPCDALRYFERHPDTDLGRAVLSIIGGISKLNEFNQLHDCDVDNLQSFGVEGLE